MRTPGALLMARHRSAESKLDAIRRRVVNDLRGAPAPATWSATLWQELFVSCRWWWRGLAAVWCLMVFVMILDGGEHQERSVTWTVSTAPMIQAMQEQQRLRNELLGLAAIEESIKAKSTPGPRSDLCREERFVWRNWSGRSSIVEGLAC